MPSRKVHSKHVEKETVSQVFSISPLDTNVLPPSTSPQKRKRDIFENDYRLSVSGLDLDGQRSPHAMLSSSMYHDRVSWMGVLSKAASDSISVSGLKYAVSAKENKGRRWLWILLILGAMSFATVQIVEQTRHFFTFPKSVDIAIEHKDKVAFPSVAICNFNKYRESRTDTVFKDLLAAHMTRRQRGSDYASLFEPYFNDTTMTEILMSNGHREQGSILRASFGPTSINKASLNVTRQVTDFGPCFMFNVGDGIDVADSWMVEGAGELFGLRLMLDLQQWDYYHEEDRHWSSGFKVHLFQKGSQPQVRDLGFVVAPGTLTLVGMHIKQVTYLPAPRGICSDIKLKYYPHYGMAECMMECQTDFVIDQCDCRMAFMPGPYRECNPVEYFSCASSVYNMARKMPNCSCPVPCTQTTYQPSVTSAMFPSTFKAAELARDLFNGEIDDTYFFDNLCAVNIFFRDLTVHRVTEQPAYSFYSLMCDIGGSLGFWLGGSILTIFELCDLVGHSACVYSRITRQPARKMTKA